jgi:hypothetical protein
MLLSLRILKQREEISEIISKELKMERSARKEGVKMEELKN